MFWGKQLAYKTTIGKRVWFKADKTLKMTMLNKEKYPATWAYKQGFYLFWTLNSTNKFAFKNTDKVCIVMRGIPFNSNEEEISKFFDTYKYIPDTIKFGIDENKRRTGFASLLFKNEEETAKAFKEKQGWSIRHRWIELFLHDFLYYSNFNEFQMNEKYVPLSSYVTEENKRRVIVLVGLPYAADESKILDFVKEFNVAKSDIVIGRKAGKSTGKAIVFMKDESNFIWVF